MFSHETYAYNLNNERVDGHVEEQEKEDWKRDRRYTVFKVACSYYNGIHVEGKREPLIILRITQICLAAFT